MLKDDATEEARLAEERRLLRRLEPKEYVSKYRCFCLVKSHGAAWHG